MKIKDSTGQSFELIQQPISISDSDRLKRSLKIGAKGIGIALACIFIPVAHFILVPAIFLYSIYNAMIKYNQTHFIDLSSVVCPRCQSKFNESVAYFGEEGLDLYCYECRSQLSLVVH